MPRPLTLRRVFVDQSLVARIFAEWVPGWIELEYRDREPARDRKQMIEQAKRFIRLAEPGSVLVSGTVKDLVSGSGSIFRTRGSTS